MFWFDSYYFILVLPCVILALIAQANVTSTFNKYSQEGTRSGLTGAQVAQRILQNAGIFDVQIEQIAGSLTDNYDPTTKVLHLSQSVYGSTSISAAGVAAHECGHAIQHAEGYAPLQLRNGIIKVTRIGSNLSMPLIILGVILGGASYYHATTIGYYIIMIGLCLFGLSTVFQLLTLPVEFNASRRAIKILGSTAMLDQEELAKAKKVLKAAALTYVAALAQSLANLLRLYLLFGRGRRDD